MIGQLGFYDLPTRIKTTRRRCVAALISTTISLLNKHGMRAQSSTIRMANIRRKC